jgi:hypothetical protein
LIGPLEADEEEPHFWISKLTFENADFGDMVNVEKTSAGERIFTRHLSSRFICRVSLSKTGVKGVLKFPKVRIKHDVKIGVRVALEKKCYNERVRLEQMQ